VYNVAIIIIIIIIVGYTQARTETHTRVRSAAYTSFAPSNLGATAAPATAVIIITAVDGQAVVVGVVAYLYRNR
jgi:hypothetical protein